MIQMALKPATFLRERILRDDVGLGAHLFQTESDDDIKDDISWWHYCTAVAWKVLVFAGLIMNEW